MVKSIRVCIISKIFLKHSKNEDCQREFKTTGNIVFFTQLVVKRFIAMVLFALIRVKIVFRETLNFVLTKS